MEELIQIDVSHQLHVIEEYDLVSRHCCAILIPTPICAGITITISFCIASCNFEHHFRERKDPRKGLCRKLDL